MSLFETPCPSCKEVRVLKRPSPHTVCRRCAVAKATAKAAETNRSDPIDRLRAKYRVASSGCWVWTSSRRSNGYGQIYFRGRMTEAHRVAYILHRGEVPEGAQLDHLCRVRECCNPWHLEAVSARTNTRRGIGPSAINHRKTHCPRGHEYSTENTYVETVRGGRRIKRHCRACRAQQRKVG